MRRRLRRRVEAAAALLAFPVAVVLTVVAISPQSSQASARVDTTPTVTVTGAEPIAVFAVADRLAGEGYDVLSAGASDNSFPGATVVVYYERRHLAAATRLRDLLGEGTIRREQVLAPSSTLTVILGKDPQRT